MAFQQPQRGLAPSPPPGGEQSFEGFALDTNTLSSTSTSPSPYSMSAMTYGSVSDWSGFAQDQNMDRKEDMQSSTLFSPNNPFSPEVGAPINNGSQPMYAYHPHQPGLANFNLMAGQFNQQPTPMQVQRPLLQTDVPIQQQQQHQHQQPMPIMPSPIQIKQEPLPTVQFTEAPYEAVEQQQQQEPQAPGGQPTRRNRTRAAATTPYQKPVVDTQALLAEEAKSLPKAQARKKKGPAKKKKEMQTDEEIAEAKRQQRLMRNRASAQASRERKKEQMSKLEKQVADLQALNAKLNAQVAALQRENDGLKQTRIIGNFNPAVSSSSEDDEAKSSPISPSSPLSDSSSPRLNPASPSMHGHNVHPLMARNLARTGMMLFALVFSVGMFYNMMELDIQQRNQAIMPSQAFRSRALQSLDEQMVQATNPALPAPMSVSQSESDGVGGEGKESAAEDDGSVKMDLDNNTSQVVNSDTLKKLPMIKPKSARTSASQSLLALALTQPQQESKTVMADNSNKAVDIWQEPTADVSSDSFAAMKDILLKSNSSSTEATYMLCPGAVQVRPTKGVKMAHNDTSGVYARLKRAGLPTPNMTDQDSAVEIDRIILSPRNNRLLLWVPTSSVVAGGAWDPALMEEPSGYKLTGLSELELRVSGIRPVLVAKNSMA